MEIKGNTNLVIAGNWNLSILTPDWFLKQFPDKIQHKKQIPVEFSVGTGAIRFTLENILVQPASNRLDLITRFEGVNHYNRIIDFAVGIVEKLPHTPITAVGHNISYYLTTEKFKCCEEEKLDELQDQYSKFIKKTVLNSQQIKHSLEFEDHILNLLFDVNRKKSYIDFNFHYKVTETQKIRNYVASFTENILSSKEIFKELVV